MKKIIYVAIALIVLTSIISLWFYFSDRGVLSGYIGKDEHFQKDGFQDYTDYCKYYYKKSNTLFAQSDTYSIVKEEDIPNIRSYFADTGSWMSAEGRSSEYDFDLSSITVGDYFYIDTKEGEPIGSAGHTYEKFDSYDVYFYDTESATLFYIHNNI